MEPNVVFGLTNIASALLIIGVSIPLVKCKVKMNHFYGVRIKQSFASEENWYRINAYGGKQLILWSIALFVAGLACFAVPIADQNKDFIAILLGICPIAICIGGAVIKIYVFSRSVKSGSKKNSLL